MKLRAYTLREKCPNAEFFLVRIFPHWYWIRRGTPYLSVFSPNAGKYGPEKILYLDTFPAVTIIFQRFWPDRRLEELYFRIAFCSTLTFAEDHPMVASKGKYGKK